RLVCPASAVPRFSTLSLHDALPISVERSLEGCDGVVHAAAVFTLDRRRDDEITATNVRATELVLGTARRLRLDPIVHVSSVSALDRKSTRLNSSHQIISYAVFCLKK